MSLSNIIMTTYFFCFRFWWWSVPDLTDTVELNGLSLSTSVVVEHCEGKTDLYNNILCLSEFETSLVHLIPQCLDLEAAPTDHVKPHTDRKV